MFTHLHNHTQFSVLDGHGKIVDYITAARDNDQKALAITDHGTLAGVIEFYAEAKKVGIQALIGCELYVDLDAQEERFPHHLTVIAANLQGYRDLVNVNTQAAKAFYYRPRVSLRKLLEEGMLANWLVLTGCPSSTINKLIKEDKPKEARTVLEMLAKGSYQLAIECQSHTSNDPEFAKMQDKLLAEQIDLAIATSIPLALTNDCHYVTKEDEAVHQEYLKRTEGRVVGIEFDGEGFHLKTQEQMVALAKKLGYPEMAENTDILAGMCSLEIPELEKPTWYVPSNYPNPYGEIDKRCMEHPLLKTVQGTYGKEKFETWKHMDYGVRFKEEMGVLSTSAPILNSYLVAADLIEWCHEQGIPASGRGSMAGSLVSHLLGITSEDPVKHNLNFKRAVNPARLTIPDFDIDVSAVRRREVLDYIGRKYPHSSPIASYTERGIRSAVRDVLRSLNYTAEYINQVSKSMPEQGWASEMDNIPVDAREVALGYVGLYRNVTVHPAGVLISGEDRPLEGLVPMGWVPTSKQFVTQFDMYSLKKIDMFKLDVLGLATLDAITMMGELTGAQPPTEYEDEEIFKLLSRGLVCEIFQLDGFAARAAIKELGISSFEDIVAINALVRPGASQFIPSYHSGSDVLIGAYPPLAGVLGITRGLILYQEQVMEIAEILAGFDDLLQDDIKEAIKYFRADVFAEIEPKFMDGCAKNGHDGQIMWDAIKAFAGYAFNRAHAVTYAATAYKMAWYKRYHPEAFYASLYDKAGSKVRLMLESIQLGIEWILPDVNLSDVGTRWQAGKIVLGLGAIKGIGEAVSEALVAGRAKAGGQFASFDQLDELVPKKTCNTRHKQLLRDVGAMRTLGLDMDEDKRTELLEFNPVIADVNIATEISVYEQHRIGGFLVDHREHVISAKAKKMPGERMGFCTVVNAGGEFNVTLFPKEWKRFKKAIKDMPAMQPVVFYGKDEPRGFVATGGELIGD